MSAVVSAPELPAVLRLHANDDVVIARRQLVSGVRLPTENVTVSGLIPPGHKVATKAIPAGSASYPPALSYDLSLALPTLGPDSAPYAPTLSNARVGPTSFSSLVHLIGPDPRYATITGA